MCLFLVGCGSQPAVTTTEFQLTPLSKDEWKTMSGNEKYDEVTIDRLKLQYPDLKTDKGWKTFLATDMKSEMAKDKAAAQASP